MKVLHIVGGLPSKERPYQSPFIKSQIDSLINEGVDVEVVNIKGYESSVNYFKAIGEIRKLVKTREIQMIHAHYSYCGLAALFANVKTPIILSLMGGELLGSPNFNGRYTLRGKIDKLLTKLIINKFAHLIIKSEEMKKLVDTNVPISVIPNGVNFKEFKPQNMFESRRRLGLDKNAFIVLFLGNSNDPIKNFNLAKKGFDIFKESKDDPKIMFINPYGIDQTSVVEYMNASNVLLLTSFYEGSPNVIKEAMACNLPIISTDVGDVKKIIKDTDNCFITGYLEGEILGKLKIIYDKMGRSNGRKNIEHLRDELIARKIINIYEKVLSTKN